MNLNAELQGIIRENESDLLLFARKLYEHGYRQGLAARPPGALDAAPEAPPPLQPLIPATPPTPGPLFPARPPLFTVPDDEEPADDGDAGAEDEQPATCDHRVRGSITVAGLQKKIERMFDLSRFDIDVVICRRGDLERRRLKASVKLKNYQLDAD